MSARHAGIARSRSSSTSSSSSVPVPSVPTRITKTASSVTQHPLFPVLLKHPRCRPFFRMGNYGVVAARVDLAQGSPTFNAMHRVFDRDDVELLGSDAKRVHWRAKENLRALFESGAMMIRTGRSTSGHAYLAIEHPTLASSCLFLPGLTQSAAAFLGGSRFAAVVLRRDLIAVFEDQGSLRACADVARSIARALVQNGATFDLELFSLDENHPQPMLSLTPSAPPPPVPPTPRPHSHSRPHSASGMYPARKDQPTRMSEHTMEERGLQRPRIRRRSDPPPPPSPPPPSPPPPPAYKGGTQVIPRPPRALKATVSF